MKIGNGSFTYKQCAPLFRRQNLILQDDPSFDPDVVYPSLDMIQWNRGLVTLPSQESSSKFSYMTPLGGGSSQASLSSGRHSALINLDIPPSSHSGGSYRINSPFGLHNTTTLGKRKPDQDAMPEFRPFEHDDQDPIEGIGLDFDGDGNLIGIFDDEPELPPLLGHEANKKPLQQADEDAILDIWDQDTNMANGEGVLNIGVAAVLPNTEASAAASAGAKKATNAPTRTSSETTVETVGTVEACAPMRRTRRLKHPNMVDQSIRVSGREYKGWDLNYISNMDASRKRRRGLTPGQARKNARALLYGNGIAHVGIYNGITASASTNGINHPLAAEFSGNSLEARLHGLDQDTLAKETAGKRGRRRKSEEAFGDDGKNITQNHPRAKQRVEEAEEVGRGGDHDNGDGDAGHLMFGDDTAPEIGMHAAPPLEDHHSSSMAPWSRAGSAVPGSSVRGSAQKGKSAPSPLFSRTTGGALHPIERFSDPAEPAHYGQGHATGPSSHIMPDDNFSDAMGPIDFGTANDTQASSQGFDSASHEFLEYTMEKAEEVGFTLAKDPVQTRRWVKFDDLVDPATHAKSVAAQAFLHVLTLKTKNAISVKQDGAGSNKPFGPIYVGVHLPDDDESGGQSESDGFQDELA